MPHESVEHMQLDIHNYFLQFQKYPALFANGKKSIPFLAELL